MVLVPPICNLCVISAIVQHSIHLLLIKLSNITKLIIYVTLLDARKKFDRVNYVKLFRFLLKRQLCQLMLRFLVVFAKTRAYVSNGLHLCEPYVLFLMVQSRVGFVNHTSHDINLQTVVSIIGCHTWMLHWQCLYGLLGYADYITLLALIFSGLKYMLNICHQFTEPYDVMLNSSKSILFCLFC